MSLCNIKHQALGKFQMEERLTSLLQQYVVDVQHGTNLMYALAQLLNIVPRLSFGARGIFNTSFWGGHLGKNSCLQHLCVKGSEIKP